ncbi:hypothetical protein [Microcoleus sp. B9-D4]|uniref:hypothetical protein n=1 Tax=Microcoleus sp. B9-D4 TaxID=2818711 RepID=UPI002FD0B2CA
MTILCIFRVMLFAGFIGGAYWSTKNLPTPYPVPFGSSALSLISLVRSNDDLTHLQAIALLMDTLLDGYQIRLSVIPPFIPALRIDG